MRATPLILNVDDDEPGRYAVGRTLRQAGYDVVEAGTGEAGFELAQARRPDLILLDIRLPDIDGYEVCRRIRAISEISSTPIVQMSASYLDSSSLVRGLNSGADAYLTEPTEPAVLIATVNSMLRMKRAEQTVLRAAQRWQNTFDAIGDGIAVLDKDGKVVQCNQSFQAMTGADEAVARMFLQIRDECVRKVEEVRVGDKSLVITISPTLNEASELAGAVGVVSDVTEKKQLEDQLRQSARLESIGVLAGGIAHDFNNLLTGILGNSTLMLESLPEHSQERELVDEIVKASQSAADLTRQILAYSGKGQFFVKPLDLSETALEVRSFVRRLIPPYVELILESDPNLPLIEGDVGQIRQLMMNLIINAAESISGNGTGQVRVSTGTGYVAESFFQPGEPVCPGDHVVLTVADTGSGMDQVTLDRIFDPFFTTKFTGRGLGLSAVRGIVRGHRGVLRVQSTLGEGTTFRLYIPVAQKAQMPELPVVRDISRQKASGTILVVDDEAHVRNFLKVALERLGYDVLLAEDGNASVRMLAERKDEVDLVLLDLTMPAMNGEEALPLLFEIRGDLPVILSSGFSQPAAEAKFRGKGLAGFLSKPYTAKTLAQVIHSVLKSEERGDRQQL